MLPAVVSVCWAAKSCNDPSCQGTHKTFTLLSTGKIMHMLPSAQNEHTVQYSLKKDKELKPRFCYRVNKSNSHFPVC